MATDSRAAADGGDKGDAGVNGEPVLSLRARGVISLMRGEQYGRDLYRNERPDGEWWQLGFLPNIGPVTIAVLLDARLIETESDPPDFGGGWYRLSAHGK